jgi:septin family protein
LVSQLYSFYHNHILIDDEGFKVNIVDYEGYNPNAKDNAKYLKLLTKELYSRHKRYLKLKRVYFKETNFGTFRATSAVKSKDPRIHMILYFIAADKNLSKTDLYNMLKLQEYSHVIPIIGKADNRKELDIIALKLELVRMAYINNINFFDIHRSLGIKLKN